MSNISRTDKSRSNSSSLAFDLDNLALDVFEVSDDGLAVESLTGAHGMTELRASACCIRLCSGSCCCCAEEEDQQQESFGLLND